MGQKRKLEEIDVGTGDGAVPEEIDVGTGDGAVPPLKLPVPPPVRILLTGGPAAGKSSAIATLRDRLSKRGFQVMVVPECATELLRNCDGFDPAWAGTHDFVALQQAFLQYQMDHERAHEAVARLGKKPTVMLFDRGSLDGRLFTTNDEWTQVLSGCGVTEEQLLQRYDLVLHIVTCADGLDELYDYGPGSSNPARYHTPSQAKDADRLTYKLYEKHPQVRVVPNFKNFSDKIGCILRQITEALHVEGLGGPRQRIPLHGEGCFRRVTERARKDVELEVFRHDITYCRDPGSPAGSAGTLEPTECLRRRTRVSGGTADVFYELRVQKIPEDPTIPAYTTRRVLTVEAYEMLARQCSQRGEGVVKDAACFEWGGKYYELIRYTTDRGSEVVLDCEAGAPVPDWIQSAVEPKAKETPLRRHNTTEMLAPSPQVCFAADPSDSPGASVMSLWTQLQDEPRLARAAAVVGEDSLSPPPKKLRLSEGSTECGSSPMTPLDAVLGGACAVCFENSFQGRFDDRRCQCDFEAVA